MDRNKRLSATEKNSRKYISSDGIQILVGKTDNDNDILSLD